MYTSDVFYFVKILIWSLFCRSPDDTESTPGFHREGFGRQSMSEKRKGHIDPKNLDVYQKIKGGKNKMPHNYGKI